MPPCLLAHCLRFGWHVYGSCTRMNQTGLGLIELKFEQSVAAHDRYMYECRSQQAFLNLAMMQLIMFQDKHVCCSRKGCCTMPPL
eukprot:1372859-Amphidinium_carterae.1